MIYAIARNEPRAATFWLSDGNTEGFAFEHIRFFQLSQDVLMCFQMCLSTFVQASFGFCFSFATHLLAIFHGRKALLFFEALGKIAHIVDANLMGDIANRERCGFQQGFCFINTRQANIIAKVHVHLFLEQPSNIGSIHLCLFSKLLDGDGAG